MIMETVVTIIGLIVGCGILATAIGVAVYKRIRNTRADLSSKNKKD